MLLLFFCKISKRFQFLLSANDETSEKPIVERAKKPSSVLQLKKRIHGKSLFRVFCSCYMSHCSEEWWRIYYSVIFRHQQYNCGKKDCWVNLCQSLQKKKNFFSQTSLRRWFCTLCAILTKTFSFSQQQMMERVKNPIVKGVEKQIEKPQIVYSLQLSQWENKCHRGGGGTSC